MPLPPERDTGACEPKNIQEGRAIHHKDDHRRWFLSGRRGGCMGNRAGESEGGSFGGQVAWEEQTDSTPR